MRRTSRTTATVAMLVLGASLVASGRGDAQELHTELREALVDDGCVPTMLPPEVPAAGTISYVRTSPGTVSITAAVSRAAPLATYGVFLRKTPPGGSSCAEQLLGTRTTTTSGTMTFSDEVQHLDRDGRFLVLVIRPLVPEISTQPAVLLTQRGMGTF